LEMEDNHSSACKYIELFLSGHSAHVRGAALDVGCGSGRLTLDVLSKRYDLVDMFDSEYNCAKIAEGNVENCKNIGKVEHAKMQDYEFTLKRGYNAVYMRWCIGYLNKAEQIAFLKKAQKALANPTDRYSRNNPPPSYIFVLDNVDERHKRDKAIYRGQKVETADYYQRLWAEAGLDCQSIQRKNLNSDYIAVLMWALY